MEFEQFKPPEPYNGGEYSNEQQLHTGEPAFSGAQPEDTDISAATSSALDHQPEDVPADGTPPEADPAPEPAAAEDRTIRIRGGKGGNKYSITVTPGPGEPGKIFIQKGLKAVDENGNPLDKLPEGVQRVGRGSIIIHKPGAEGEPAETEVVSPLRAALQGLRRRFLGE